MGFTYNRDIPFSTHNPSTDQPLMQTNTNSIDDLINVDHFTFSSGQAGKHNVVRHPTPQSPMTSPGTGALEWAYYTKTLASGAVETFWQRPAQLVNGPDIQMTTNLAPTASTNGYTFIPGGLIIQWGQITATTSSYTSLLFATNNVAFPNNCYDVFTQPYATGTEPGSQATVAIRKSSVSKTGFQWAFITNSGEYTGFYWWAIGN